MLIPRTRRIVRAEHKIRTWLTRLLQLKPINTLDPITQYPPELPIFKHVSASSTVTAFSARPLLAYLLESGCLEHPVSRCPFLPVELRRLQKICGSAVDIVGLRSQLLAKRADDIERRSMLDFLENQFESVIVQMMRATEMTHVETTTSQRIINWLQGTAISEAAETLGQLIIVDCHRAKQSCEHMKDMLARATSARCAYNEHLLQLVQNVVNGLYQAANSYEDNLS